MSSQKNLLLLLVFSVLGNLSQAQSRPVVPFDSDVDHLFKTLNRFKVTNVEQAVSLFEDRFFQKENYALLFNSMSPQRSTPHAPRVLLFGAGKKMRVGFNHHHKEGQDLEVIQWREMTQTWEFREIKFLKGKATLSKANPSVCIGCHDDYKPKSLSQNSFELRVSSWSHPGMVSSSGLSSVALGHTSKPLVVKHSRLTPSENSHSQTNFGIGSKFQGTFMASVEKTMDGKMGFSLFKKRVRSDAIYKRLQGLSDKVSVK